MRKSLIGLWAIIIIFIGIIISFYVLTAFTTLKTSETHIQNVNREKRSTNFKINEEDFINTMFLRSSFFENWSDTNYFVNPTLKTSKLLTYNENWYMDFLKDSYATGIVFDKPSDKFLDLYKNWDNYVKQYKLDRFYYVDKKFFLKDLTNFMYTYFMKYRDINSLFQFENVIKNLEQVKFNEDNWKLIDDIKEEKKKNFWLKTYIEIIKESNTNYKILNSKGIHGTYTNLKAIYRWDGINEPIIPTIDKNTGEIIDWNE